MSPVMQKCLMCLILRTYIMACLVKVKYGGEILLGKFLSLVNNHTQARCLKLPFGILELQEFEREEDAVFYETVYATGVNPVVVKNGRK